MRSKSLDKLNEIKNRINIKDVWVYLSPTYRCKKCDLPILMINEDDIKCMNCNSRYKRGVDYE